MAEMQILQGMGVSGGIAVGHVYAMTSLPFFHPGLVAPRLSVVVSPTAASREAFRRRAIQLRLAEQSYRHPSYRDEVEDPAVADHLGRLADKYERAARYPWLPVDPDPPPPK